MSALAHFFEDEGLATVIVALVREHAEKMSPPRALWVPFELGRPFGAPGDTGLQTRVLRAALALFDQPGSDPVLEDFPGEMADPQGEDDWIFPGELNQASLLDEVASILPLWEQAIRHRDRTTVGISGLSPQLAAEYVERYFSHEPMPNPGGMAAISRARFAVDDIKAFYLESATAHGGYPSSYRLQEWFWERTLAGFMIREFQQRVLSSEDRNVRGIADSLVPAERVNKSRSSIK